MKRKKMFVAGSLLIILLPVLVGAQTPNPKNNEVNGTGNNLPTRSPINWQEKKEEFDVKRCEDIKGRIEKQTNKIAEGQNRRVLVYEEIKSEVVKFLDIFGALGYSTQTLETNLSILEGYMEEFYGAHGVFVDEVQVAREYSCTSTQEDFDKQINKIKAQAQVLKQLRIKIRNYIMSDIIPEIRKLVEEYNANPKDIPGMN